MFPFPSIYYNKKENRGNKYNLNAKEEKDGIALKSVKYEEYYKSNPENENQRETFCEAFFLCSIPYGNGHFSERCKEFKATCEHEECSSVYAFKPEIILKYPLKDKKDLTLNFLASSICFPKGIKLCFSKETPKMKEDYGTWIINERGLKFYMWNFHFYLKMTPSEFSKIYKHPLVEYYLNALQNEYRGTKRQVDFNFKIANIIMEAQSICIPFCICLISKYRYEKQMKACLESIYQLLIKNKEDLENSKLDKLSYLIKYLIYSVPIPNAESNVVFYIPHTDPLKNSITLAYPKLEGCKVKDNFCELFKLFSNDDIIRIISLLLLEKKLIFIDNDYARLSRVICYFDELLYPIQWVHTFIPIMTFEMLRYFNAFLPIVGGVDYNLLTYALKMEDEENYGGEEGVFFIYISGEEQSYIFHYLNRNILPLGEMEGLSLSILNKDLKSKLDKIKEKFKESVEGKKDNNIDNIDNINLEIRYCFIETFSQMFHNIKKYVGLLDSEDFGINKTLFYSMKKVGEKDKKFYDDLFETMNFRFFINDLMDKENKLKYFMNKIESNNKTGETFETFAKKDEVNKIYKIKPDYFKINEENISQNNSRNDKNIQEIDVVSENLKSKNFDIYLMPEKTEELKKQVENKKIAQIQGVEEDKKGDYEILRRVSTFSLKGKNNENEIKKIEEIIKQFMVKIFNSDETLMGKGDENNEQFLSYKRDIQMLINKNVGRKYFISLLLEKKSNAILLKGKFFNILGNMIYNTLIYLKQENEDEEAIKQMIQLAISTKYFRENLEEKEKTETSKIGKKEENSVPKTRTLWDVYQNKIKDVTGSFYDTPFWFHWYDILLKKEKEKEKEINEVRKSLIFKICDLMIECDLGDYFISCTCSALVEELLEERERKGIITDITEKIKKKYPEPKK